MKEYLKPTSIVVFTKGSALTVTVVQAIFVSCFAITERIVSAIFIITLILEVKNIGGVYVCVSPQGEADLD